MVDVLRPGDTPLSAALNHGPFQTCASGVYHENPKSTGISSIFMVPSGAYFEFGSLRPISCDFYCTSLTLPLTKITFISL